MTNCNPKQEEGKKAIESLLRITNKLKKAMTIQEEVIEDLIERGVFD